MCVEPSDDGWVVICLVHRSAFAPIAVCGAVVGMARPIAAFRTCRVQGKSVTATACKIAVLFNNAVRQGMIYQHSSAAQYEECHRNRVAANLERRARPLGFTLHVTHVVREAAVS